MTNEFECLENSFVYLNDKGFAVGQKVPFTDVNGKESLRVEYDNKYKRGVLEHHKEGKIFTLYSSFNEKKNKKVVMYNCVLCNSHGVVGRRDNNVDHLNNHCLGKKHTKKAEEKSKVLEDKNQLENKKESEENGELQNVQPTSQNVQMKRKKGFSTLHGFFQKKLIVETVETGVASVANASRKSAEVLQSERKEKQRVLLKNCVGVFEDFRKYSSRVRAC
eukprot:Pgem_evm1s7044